MADKKIRTIAFQVDDQDFVADYEARVKASGLSVKNYFVGLIKADIAQNQTQKESYAQNETQENAPQAEQTHGAPSQQTDEAPASAAEPEQNHEQAHDTPSQQMDETPAPAAEPDHEPEQEQSGDQPQETDIQSEDTENITDADTEISEQEQSGDAPEPEDIVPDAPVQEEMMNLFVKITKDQREALEQHKNESGETVGSVLNRLIKDFLTGLKDGSQPENFNDTYSHYDAAIKSCDTTCSAKIPVEMNKELSQYLESTGKSRNVLMSSLVHIELHSQEQAQNQSMSM